MVLPLLLEQGMGSSVSEIRVLALTSIAKVTGHTCIGFLEGACTYRHACIGCLVGECTYSRTRAYVSFLGWVICIHECVCVCDCVCTRA